MTTQLIDVVPPKVRNRLLVNSTIHLGLYLILVACSTTVGACGWWGDGESGNNQAAVIIGKDGKPVQNNRTGSAAIADMKIPKQMGYGIAVYQADKAIPYLRAIKNRQTNTIQELKKLGFVTVIDIGSGPHASIFHSKESSELGLNYVYIQVDQNGFATPDGSQELHQAIQNFKRRPLLVYAPKVDVLATAWGKHRLQQGRRWHTIEKDVNQLGISVDALKKLQRENM
jgi:hypothetical protein